MTDPEPLIAVVDDESPVRVMLGRVLRLADYRVGEYACGEDFLASLDGAQLPLCAIVDLHMPGLSGFEVQSRIRAATLKVPVVFITASDDPGLDRSALALGGRGLLRKPFSSDQLFEAIVSAVGQRDNGNAGDKDGNDST
ncbi:response regulator transcription factor [Variovorax rhizosphaerae]|uniref:Response regulator n=1 Tax=Variovorax rhizosphaerae TaxID=1836200 RepID=A0ABU8WD94_9BURK